MINSLSPHISTRNVFATNLALALTTHARGASDGRCRVHASSGGSRGGGGGILPSEQEKVLAIVPSVIGSILGLALIIFFTSYLRKAIAAREETRTANDEHRQISGDVELGQAAIHPEPRMLILSYLSFMKWSPLHLRNNSNVAPERQLVEQTTTRCASKV